MLDFAIFAVTVVIFLVVAIFYLYPGSRRQTTIPGLDPSDPKDGNLSDIVQAGGLHQFLVELHHEHGSVASFWMGQTLVVSLASAATMAAHQQVFDRPVELFSLYKPLIRESSLLLTNGRQGRARRKIWDHALDPSALPHISKRLEKFVNELLTKWSALPADQHVPLFQFMVALCMKACTSLAFGQYFEDDKNIVDFSRNFQICWMDLESRVLGDVPEPDSPQDQRFQEGVSNLHKAIRKATEARRTAGDDGGALLDFLMQEDVSEEMRLDDSLLFIFKHYSLASAMTWALYFLASHQDVQEKAYKEIKDVLGSKLLSKEAVGKFKYIRQVIDETLRTAIVESWTARFQELDVEIGGHIIPKKTPVIHALGVLMHDSKIWPSPQSFDPERFDDKAAKSRHSLDFRPFGFAGKRQCPGADLVYLQMTLYLASICRKFELSMANGQVVTPQYRLISRPEEEVWVTLKKRV